MHRVRRSLPLALGGAISAVATARCYSTTKLDTKSPQKSIHKLSFTVKHTESADFRNWLPTYLQTLLEFPGMLGAKVLQRKTQSAAQKPLVVFVLGGPGAGKGTQCAKIVDEFGYKHLSAGDLLRAERNSGSDQGKLIDDVIREGKIVPVEITVRLLADAIQADGGNRFLVDGFPRNTNNISGWQKVVGEELNAAAVLVYDCPEEVLEERLIERGKTSGRTDDNIDSIRKRFHTYQAETMPVIKYYDHQRLVTVIDGTRPVDEVWADSRNFIMDVENQLKSAPVTTDVLLFAHVLERPYVENVFTRIASDV